MIELRPYQQTALDALLASIAEGCNPVCAIATGGGKSVVIAALAQKLDGRILVATHRQELLEQNAVTLANLSGYSKDIGIYSAGLNSRQKDRRVVFAGIQSIYRRMGELQAAGAFRAVIVDEAHRVVGRDSNSMYSTVFGACPNAALVGFSATPYRLDAGLITEGKNSWFDDLAVNIGMAELTKEDWLAPLAGIHTAHDVDMTAVRVRQGDFVTADVSQVVCEEEIVQEAVSELTAIAERRKKWLLFGVDVMHVKMIHDALEEAGIDSAYVTGATPQDERRETLDAYRRGDIRALVNCEVLTTGFDVPDVDCVAVLRPTMSKGLFVQMLGRGSRKADGKVDCLILDMAGNFGRFLPLAELPTVSKSAAKERQEQEKKEEEDRQRRARTVQHGIKPSELDPMSDASTARVLQVEFLSFAIAASRNPKHQGRQMLVATYRGKSEWGHSWVRLWLCVEHRGPARMHAERWFDRRGLVAPRYASDALRVARTARRPSAIVVRKESGFDRILVEHFDDLEPVRFPELWESIEEPSTLAVELASMLEVQQPSSLACQHAGIRWDLDLGQWVCPACGHKSVLIG